jgi:hypothetical protein
MIDFDEALKISIKADEYVKQLESEDNMCKIADMIDEMDTNVMKMVLKKFVYKQ